MAGKVRRALPRRRHFSEKVIFYMMVGYLLMAVLFGCMYFVNARQSTEAQVVDQIGHSLDRTRLDLEGLIETCENVYVSLLSDGELYDFLVGYDAGETSYPSARRTVNALLQDAIRNIDVLCSVQLMSDDYVFYTSNTTYTSVANVQESMIYQAAKRVNSPFWTSLYDFTREYGHTQLEDPEIPVANRNLISYVGPFNAYRLDESTLRMWPSEVEKPVVFINLSEESVREILTNTSSLYDGACFLVDDRETCIAHTARKDAGHRAAQRRGLFGDLRRHLAHARADAAGADAAGRAAGAAGVAAALAADPPADPGDQHRREGQLHGQPAAHGRRV